MSKHLVALVVLCLLGACGGPSSDPAATVTPPPNVKPEEYAVLSALIRQNPVGYDLGDLVVIREQTAVSNADLFERTLEEHPGLPQDLVDSYRSRNAASYALDRSLSLEKDYALLAQADYDELFGSEQEKWADFEAQYPDTRGWVNVSRVGFNAAGDQALVLMGFRCSGLCGGGGLYLLAKVDGIWHVQEPLVGWMS